MNVRSYAAAERIGLLLIIAGILLPLASILLSPAFDGHDSILMRIARGVWTGEVVLREGKNVVLPDRDETLYREFLSFREERAKTSASSDEEMIEQFYLERYRDEMPRVLFRLKLEKHRVETLQSKIAIPNRILFFGGIVLIVTGESLRIMAKRKATRRYGT